MGTDGHGVNGTYEFLLLPSVLDSNIRFPVLAVDLEGEVLNIRLYLSISEFTANETLGIENAKGKMNISQKPNYCKMPLTCYAGSWRPDF